MDTGSCSRVLFNQYRWGTVISPAIVLYSVTYASRAARSLFQGHSCSKSPPARFRSNWVKCDYNRPSDRQKRYDDCNRIWPNLIETFWRDFLQLGPWRGRKQPWKDLGERSDPFWGEEGLFPNVVGANAHANLLKGTIPTDFKSNCILASFHRLVWGNSVSYNSRNQ